MRKMMRLMRERRERLNEVLSETKERHKAGGNYWDTNEAMYRRLTEIQPSPRWQDQLEKIQESRKQVEALQKIRTDAGDDKSQLVEGFRKYTTEHPESETAQICLALALMESGDKAASLALFEDELKKADKGAISSNIVRIHRGRALAKACDIDGAVADFDYVIDNATSHAQVYAASSELGEALKSAGRVGEAIEAWELAVQYSLSDEMTEKPSKRIDELRSQLPAKTERSQIRVPKIPPPKWRQVASDPEALHRCLKERALFLLCARVMETRSSGQEKFDMSRLRKIMERMPEERGDFVGQWRWFFNSGTTIGLLHEGLHPKSTDDAPATAKLLQPRELDAIMEVLHEAGQDDALKIQKLRDYIADHPESDKAYSYLGIELLEAGDVKGSMEAYRNAARLAGENTERGRRARLGVGQALMKKGDLDGAIAEYESVLEEAEDEHEVTFACLYLGKAFDRAGRRAEADEAFDMAVRYCSDQEYADLMRERIDAKRGR